MRVTLQFRRLFELLPLSTDILFNPRLYVHPHVRCMVLSYLEAAPFSAANKRELTRRIAEVSLIFMSSANHIAAL